MLFGNSYYVTCEECGTIFDLTFGGYYTKKPQRFFCKRCFKKMKRQERKNSWLGRNWKAIAGAWFIISAIYGFFTGDESAEPGIILLALIIGIILLVSHFRSKKKK